MGYHTDFAGCFKLDGPLTREQREYLLKFTETRRVRRDPKKAARLGDPARTAAGIMEVGVEGGYFTGGLGCAGQDHDESVFDGNEPPAGQPGLWCQWGPSECGQYIGWDGGEKFYEYVEWLQYIIDHFLARWGLKLNGVVRWRGECPGDRGSIVVVDNVITKRAGEKLRLTHGTKMKRDSW
jgi:hypothetical protein